MNKINFSVTEFPKLRQEFYVQDYTDWITFLYDLGYKFEWQHYASKRKYVAMDEDEFTLFLLRWA
jgi:hypothetical protein